MEQSSDFGVSTAKEVWVALFRPPCFGNSIHCPVLFTSKMYECKHYRNCELETQKKWRKILDERNQGLLEESLQQSRRV